MRRAYSYIRFSNFLQSQGDSLRRQTKQREDYCKRAGLILDTGLELRDLGISAFRGKNVQEGALAGFLEAIKLGRVPSGSILIVESLDRLSRDQIGHALSLFISILNSGVNIVTLTPEREYSQASINDIAGLLEPIIVMQRAHEESATKSKRGRSAWEGKRERIAEAKLTGRIPAWLTLSEDKTTFIIDDAKAAAVRRLFTMATVDGMGINAIAKKLNADQVPGLARRNYWQKSYVTKILTSRAVLGEYQPHVLEGGKRKPHGEPIADYYPRLIEDDQFYQTQKALTSRLTQRGPSGKTVANLFTGILFDARDGTKMNTINKGKKSSGKQLVSSGAIRGQAGSTYQAFRYEYFEQAFFYFVQELKASDFVASPKPDGIDEISKLTGRLAELDHKIERIKARMEDEDIDALIDILKKFEAQKKTVKDDLERIKMSCSDIKTENLGELQSLGKMLATTTDADELAALRTKIKSRIRNLVADVWMLIKSFDKLKTAIVQVNLSDGKSRQFLVSEDGFMIGCTKAWESMVPTLDLQKIREFGKDHFEWFTANYDSELRK